MDKGRKKLQKRVNQIKKNNEKVLKKEIKKIVNLKKINISEINTRADSKFAVMIHEETGNFDQTREHVLQMMNKYLDDFPFMDLHLAKGNETRKITIRIFWGDYCKFALPQLKRPGSLPQLGAEEAIFGINDKNDLIIDNAVETILSQADEQRTSEHSDLEVKLEKQTMTIPASRRHFQEKRMAVQTDYPFVEVYRIKLNIVLIRVWWELYYHYLQATGKIMSGGSGVGNGGGAPLNRLSIRKKIKTKAKKIAQNVAQSTADSLYPTTHV